METRFCLAIENSVSPCRTSTTRCPSIMRIGAGPCEGGMAGGCDCAGETLAWVSGGCCCDGGCGYGAEAAGAATGRCCDGE